jgi:hypothetical protein
VGQTMSKMRFREQLKGSVALTCWQMGSGRKVVLWMDRRRDLSVSG